ncbi:unnamed protein product, partial [Scytosiphon promiscuus]
MQGKASPTNTGPGLIRRFFQLDGASIALVFVLLILIFMITAPKAFLGYRVYMSFMATVPPPLIIALGVTLVAVAGEMDLSFPSVVAAARFVVGIMFKQWDVTWIAFLCAIAVGAGMGLVNGLVVTLLGIPSLIATLAMLFLWGGLVTVLSGGIQLAIPDIYGTAMHSIVVGRIGGVFPDQMIWAL